MRLHNIHTHTCISDGIYTPEKRIIDAIPKLKQWQIDTNDPFNDPVKHQRFDQEIKETLEKYPNKGYQKDPDFKWEYVDCFNK